MINGSIVDLIIPTASDGSPDYETVETLIDWHIDNGSAALLIGCLLYTSPSPRDS